MPQTLSMKTYRPSYSALFLASALMLISVCEVRAAEPAVNAAAPTPPAKTETVVTAPVQPVKAKQPAPQVKPAKRPADAEEFDPGCDIAPIES